jgi:predicted dehydrogenase
VDDAEQAYERLVSDEDSPLGIVIHYDATPVRQREDSVARVRTEPIGTRVGVIGAGSFAQGTMIPGLIAAGFELKAIASATGRSAHAAQSQFSFDRVDGVDEILAAEDVDVVAIASRHSTHAEFAIRAFRAGKAVFVEKPPCLTADELGELRDARAEAGLPLLVGFNRRHAPLAIDLRRRIRQSGHPFELLFRVNAGALPDGHWLNDPDDGGGRLRGEGCHFVDFACWFAGELPTRVTTAMRAGPGQQLVTAQSFNIALDFADGSLATVFYSAAGGRQLDKEYVEAHSAGQSAALDDFKRDKGHNAQFAHLRDVVAGATAPADPDPLETMAVTLAALRSAETGTTIAVRP